MLLVKGARHLNPSMLSAAVHIAFRKLCKTFVEKSKFQKYHWPSFIQKVIVFICRQWRTQEFCLGGVQQMQLRTEDRENGDLGAVAT